MRLSSIPTDAQKGTNLGFLIANKEHYMVLLIIGIAQLPGQPPLLHFLFSLSDPSCEQSFPPGPGAGLVQERLRL